MPAKRTSRRKNKTEEIDQLYMTPKEQKMF